MERARGRRALFVVNLQSRKGRALAQKARSMLSDLGFELVDVSSDGRASTAASIRRGLANRPDLIVAGGGDGTLNAVANAIAGTRLPLGILPLGTANDVARAVGVPQKLEDACGAIAGGATRRIDVGRVNDRIFLNDASLGFTAAIASQLTTSTKRRWGIFAAAGIAARSLTRARRFSARIRTRAETLRVMAYQITIGNGKFFGGLLSSEDALVDDRRLDLYVLESKRIADVARVVPHLENARRGANPAVLTRKGGRFVIETARPMRIYTDGEPAAWTPATVCVVPAALAVYVPPGSSP
jgi:YegS/Rv2252/BmrU family lipid kinase